MPAKQMDIIPISKITFFLFIVLFSRIGFAARATCATLAARVQLHTHAHASFICLMEKGFSFYAMLLVKELFT